jgi:hypothetical protein
MQALHTVKHQVHLKNVPDYIIPEALRSMAGISTGRSNKKRPHHFKPKTTETQKRFNKRKSDPLDMGLSKRKR